MDGFVFANFFKILKKYTNETISNLEFVYFLFSKVNKDKDDEKTELRINKSQVSRILSRTDDVPARVRKYYCDKKNLSNVQEMFEEFLDERFEEGMEDELADELRDLYIKDPAVEGKIKKYLDGYRDDDFSKYFAEILIEALKRDNRLSCAPVEIYSKGNTSVSAVIDDILKIGFSNKYVLGKKIIVIPVNTTFDMKATNPEDAVQHVSLVTLHGKWINKMKDKGYSENDLSDLVNESLRNKNINIPSEAPIGTIVVVKNNDTYFYLLAISIFYENNVAHSEKELLSKAIDSLISFYNINGQGYPLYIPLMGTGRSRINLSHKESFELLKNKILDKIDEISGNINIVIYTQNIEGMEGLLYGMQK